MAEDDHLVSMLERCSREEYVYFDCKTNRTKEQKIVEYQEKVAKDSWNFDSNKLKKPQKIKNGNFGFLREIGNCIDRMFGEKKSLFTNSKFIIKLR
jgi:hypothetical protein